MVCAESSRLAEAATIKQRQDGAEKAKAADSTLGRVAVRHYRKITR